VAEQSFERHGHHPVPTYVASAFGLVAIIWLIGAWLFERNTLEVGAVSLSLAVATLIAISRWYNVRQQERINMHEMKVRCAHQLSAGQDARLADLTPKQIVALRFASDEELGDLLERAIREKLPPKEIKRAVKRWRPDHLRT
jgi:hypothetical protein